MGVDFIEEPWDDEDEGPEEVDLYFSKKLRPFLEAIGLLELAPDYKTKQKIKKAYRYYFLYGGRGSSKSWSVAIALLLLGTTRPLRILCTREYQNSIKDSVYRLLCDQIDRLKLNAYYRITNDEIKGHNGTQFIFKGLKSNPDSVKSMEGLDIAWIEEAHRITEDSFDILEPTIRKNDSYIICTLNPTLDSDYLYSNFVVPSRPDTLKIEINYMDNKRFPDVLRASMEWDKQYNYPKYLHKWKGQTIKYSDALIFKDMFTVTEFATPADATFMFGGDFGTRDLTTLVRMFEKDDCLYIDYEAYGAGVKLRDIPALYDTVPGSRDEFIYADNSRPDTIDYIKDEGFNVVPCYKGAAGGKSSITEGLEMMKNYKMIYVHPRCTNAVDEFSTYSYKVDPHTKQISNIPVDKKNHSIDAIRYPIYTTKAGPAQPMADDDLMDYQSMWM